MRLICLEDGITNNKKQWLMRAMHIQSIKQDMLLTFGAHYIVRVKSTAQKMLEKEPPSRRILASSSKKGQNCTVCNLFV
ncbi:hypothetical protein K1T71_003255 [Dendrolimus kikuchii]|uniref:Uncharacterized protein n=1 Tax=Dendrolimus kikuchii TaxID=765133 RepID=A0ACC1DBD8_9NEOP|nr:hypothetical protein K1T71_003255 [Dendrolimus kikuchii]